MSVFVHLKKPASRVDKFNLCSVEGDYKLVSKFYFDIFIIVRLIIKYSFNAVFSVRQ